MPTNPLSTVSRKSRRNIDPDHGLLVTLSVLLQQPWPYAVSRVPASPGAPAAVPAPCRPLRAELQLIPETPSPEIGRRGGWGRPYRGGLWTRRRGPTPGT